ncbi:DUF3152 domain-containing protein [Streptomyces sp. cmx-4-9]|uniref:DUF3152 domain-containing protein n=1 Tax=Streptomyces sp. cmx-4-9 TaxID=2790941 RepID=UPI0039801748
MGRHSRRAPSASPAEPPAALPDPYGEPPDPYGEPRSLFEPAAPHGDPYGRPYAEPTVRHRGYAPTGGPWPEWPGERPGGHPEQREPGGAWGAGPDTVHGDRQGAPRTAAATAPAPAVRAAPAAAASALTSTGSHRRIPGPRGPVGPGPGPAAPAAPAPEAPDGEADACGRERPGSGRSRVRTYGGVAAAAVATLLAVVVAVQVAAENDVGRSGAVAAPDDGPSRAAADAASRSDGRPTPHTPAGASAAPPAPELTYEQKMAQLLPVDARLTGPGTFDTVPGVAQAPGKGKVVRYRVDVEQGLGLDPQLFAEAVHRTLNDPRSWGRGGTRTFERVPGGEADFVITLASPGTTGVWCAKSGLDTTVDNVSCDSASTDRVMINAYRWGQGSPTYGPEQMFAYRQMLINHETGHRLGHGHVNCRTPGALAPIMQQQTKSLNIDGVACKPNPWVFPGS